VICTPEAPVPIIAQRLFSTGISVSGQKELWWTIPLNLSMPGQGGM
jgi:hypothetical protein